MSISIMQAKNNNTKINEIYSLFFVIVDNFFELFQSKNNTYKYSEYYVSYIDDALREETLSIINCIIFILMSIQYEGTLYRERSNDKLLKSLEKKIINNSIYILTYENNLQHLIANINEILSTNIDEYSFKYEETYKTKVIINYNPVVEINNDNIKDIYENFHKLKRLVDLTKENTSHNIEKIHNIDNYLFFEQKVLHLTSL